MSAEVVAYYRVIFQHYRVIFEHYAPFVTPGNSVQVFPDVAMVFVGAEHVVAVDGDVVGVHVLDELVCLSYAGFVRDDTYFHTNTNPTYIR